MLRLLRIGEANAFAAKVGVKTLWLYADRWQRTRPIRFFTIWTKPFHGLVHPRCCTCRLCRPSNWYHRTEEAFHHRIGSNLFRSQGGQYSYYSVQRFPLPRLSSKLRNTTTEPCQMINTELGPGVTWGRHWFQSKDSSSLLLHSISKKKYKFLAREPYVIYSFFQSSFP